MGNVGPFKRARDRRILIGIYQSRTMSNSFQLERGDSFQVRRFIRKIAITSSSRGRILECQPMWSSQQVVDREWLIAKSPQITLQHLRSCWTDDSCGSSFLLVACFGGASPHTITIRLTVQQVSHWDRRKNSDRTSAQHHQRLFAWIGLTYYNALPPRLVLVR